MTLARNKVFISLIVHMIMFLNNQQSKYCSIVTAASYTHTHTHTSLSKLVTANSGVPRNFFWGGVQQIQLTEGRENRDLGAVAPHSGVSPNLQMGETCILIRFWKFGSALSKLGNNFGGGGGLIPQNPPSGYASDCQHFYQWKTSFLNYLSPT
jgi:hypothetical protein